MRLHSWSVLIVVALSAGSFVSGCSSSGGQDGDSSRDTQNAGPVTDDGNGDNGSDNDTDGSAKADAGQGTPAADSGSLPSDTDWRDSCKTLCNPNECGHINDGCGGTIDCGNAETACGEGYGCRAGKCVEIPPACAPISPEEACDGKTCGIVGVGCNATVDCGTVNGGCNPSLSYCQDFECVDLPISDPDQCPSLRTCVTAAVECGVASNGCGGTMDCGSAAEKCAQGQYCQGNQCKIPSNCEPALSKAQACAGRCGVVSDGCAGSYDCSTQGTGPGGTHCAASEVCRFGACVSPNDPPTSCDPGVIDEDVCDKVDGACGIFTDACGRPVDCGRDCDADDEWCGGGSAGFSDAVYGTIEASNLCGRPACVAQDAAAVCAKVGAHGGELCGLVPRGCGLFADCGGCTREGEHCGIDATKPGECAAPVCAKRPIATACAGVCGHVSDGCSGVYNCDTFDSLANCTSNQVCGGYGAPAGTCGSPPACIPLTCQQAGASCGYASNGCGGTIDCGGSANNLGCDALSTCIGNPPRCVSGADDDDDGCVGEYCDALPSCNNITIRGRVVTPGYVAGTGRVENQFGVRNAVVYIPKSASTPLPAIVDGPSCDRCEDTDLGPVLNSAVTNALGDFTLTGAIPTGVPKFRLVIKSGKWRRVVMVDTTGMTCGTTKTLDLNLTRLPRNQRDGEAGTNIPKIAITTGSSDALECVFYDMGIDAQEFTVLGDTRGDGRIHLYGDDGNALGGTRPVPTCNGKYNGINCSADNNFGCVTGKAGCSWTYSAAKSVPFVPEHELIADYNRMNDYDIMVFDCHGGDHEEVHAAAAGTTGRANVERFVNYGGRLFLTHWSKDWIEKNGSLDKAATYAGKGAGKSDMAALSYAARGGNVERLSDLATWLDTFASDTTGTWSASGASLFGFPIDGQNAMVNSIHPSGVDEWIWHNDNAAKATQTFSFDTPLLQTPAGQPWCEAEPGDAYCKDCGRVTYSVFHVTEKGSRSGTSISQLCNARAPMTTQEKVLLYMLFDLAACTGGVIDPPECTPTPKQEVCQAPSSGPNAGLIACGSHGDGCGATTNCGNPCPTGSYCNGGYCRPAGCTPQTCASLGFECGVHQDGCGGELNCEQTPCTRGASCPDGCDDTVVDQICGLTQPGICAPPACIPQQVCAIGNNTDGVCGQLSNGCALVDCGTCPQGQACGASEPNRCGVGQCTPKTCDDLRADTNRFPLGIECGQLSDGCGGIARDLDGKEGCGRCEQPETCNGSGTTPYVCSEPICTPKTCADLERDTARFPNGLECGFHSDGCGGIARSQDGSPGCGQCPNGAQCGAGGVGLCGESCVPKTCEQVIDPADGKTTCGLVNNGCAIVQCGACTKPGDVCGAQSANVCDPGYSCKPKTCAEMATLLGRTIECGLVGDGCGGSQLCGACTEPGEHCGGAGVPNVCGGGDFVCEDKRTCAEILGVNPAEAATLCGSVGNDCGEIVDCGDCARGYQCGLEDPYRCGCVPSTWDEACGAFGYECGGAPDGCGGTVSCGECGAGSTCGADNLCETVVIL